MTPSEWAEHVRWIKARWPHVIWGPDQLEAGYSDLAEFDDEIVAEALRRIRDDGGDFAPSPPAIRKRALAVRAEVNRYPSNALPAPMGPRGEEALRAFAAEHDGYSPTQQLKRELGFDPGEPAYPDAVTH